MQEPVVKRRRRVPCEGLVSDWLPRDAEASPIGWAARWPVNYQSLPGERRPDMFLASDAILLAGTVEVRGTSDCFTSVKAVRACTLHYHTASRVSKQYPEIFHSEETRRSTKGGWIDREREREGGRQGEDENMRRTCEEPIRHRAGFGIASASSTDVAQQGTRSLHTASIARHNELNPFGRSELHLYGDDKIDFKHVYTEVDFAIGSQLIRHALDNSEPIADLLEIEELKKLLLRISLKVSLSFAKNARLEAVSNDPWHNSKLFWRTVRNRVVRNPLEFGYFTAYTKLPPKTCGAAVDDAVRTLASHQGEPGSIPGRATPGFSQLGIVPYDAAGRAGFLGHLPEPLHYGAAPPSPHFALIGSQDLVVKNRPNLSILDNSENLQEAIAAEESAISCSKQLSQYSRGAISGNHGEPKSRLQGRGFELKSFRMQNLMFSLAPTSSNSIEKTTVLTKDGAGNGEEQLKGSREGGRGLDVPSRQPHSLSRPLNVDETWSPNTPTQMPSRAWPARPARDQPYLPGTLARHIGLLVLLVSLNSLTNRIRLETASQNTHKIPYNRVKWCRECKINIKASERVNVDVFTQNQRPCPQHSQTQFLNKEFSCEVLYPFKGPAEATRLDHLPPTKVNRVHFPAESLRVFASGNHAGRYRWSAGFLGDLPGAPFSPHFTLTGSQDLVIKSLPNLATQLNHCHDGNTARLARRSDEALEVRVSVARIAPSLLDLGPGVPTGFHSTLNGEVLRADGGD
ncbi:hypothetical protein PR048_027477 [Dryococelus australis]|uniref:Uncharacterized protein n=1 Tax=Dryococelus australis TaxID=614101 RepID=A0ABQ9GGP2_9NEOP|nr:hypothetical protein PR048_027477 [Dryococelus australis]